MDYKRRYLQFNDLVFYGADMLTDAPHSVDFKGDTEEYGFGHGSYDPWKRDYLFAKEQSVSLSLTFNMRELPCEYRDFYKQFGIQQLTKQGKLWAVVNHTLLWAYARATSISESEDAKKDQYRVEVDFILPEGIWHKANKLKTFLVPFDICTFMECLDFKKNNPCEYDLADGDCCSGCMARKSDEAAYSEDCCCCCDEITKDMALCYADLQEMYAECEIPYQIVYNCRKGNEFFADKYLGEKICTKDTCNNIISGRFYSETEIPTTGYEIVIDGDTHDPQITINGNKNIIKGDYERLFIKSNGDVYSETKNKCCKKLLDPSVWVIPTEGDEYGWTIRQGENRLVIDRGSCCGNACAYIQMDNLTI